MKLVFSKNDDNQVTVCQETDGQPMPFSYVDMIRALLHEGSLEPPDLNGDFAEPERESINRMVALINKRAIEDAAEEYEGNDEESGESIND